MTELWQVSCNLASTTSCERRVSTQNHIKSSLWCSLVLETFEAQMIVAMVEISREAIDFEQL